MLLILHVALYSLFVAALWLGSRMTASSHVLMLGGLTYPLYLLHQNIGYVALDALSPSIGRWPALTLTIATVIVAAWIVWRFIEPAGRRLVSHVLGQLETRSRMVLGQLASRPSDLAR